MNIDKTKEEIKKTNSEICSARSEIERINDKLSKLNAQKKLLTKRSRNNYIFHLGLLVEKNIRVAHYLSDEDLKYVFNKAFSNPEILSLIDQRAKSNIKATIKVREDG